MYEYNYIYGVILIDREYENVNKAIDEMSNSEQYNYIHSSMFSKGNNEYPYFYESYIISFSRTFKYLGYDLEDFNELIWNIETLLNRISFESAMLHIGGMYSEQDLFWIKKNNNNNSKQLIKSEIKFYETENWYFGFGKINLSTGMIDNTVVKEKNEYFETEYPNFKYPIEKN
ncbi:hypothetical protein GCM10011344_04190 [Dokdonia pacifica]|uniref:Uncharacterized protein n=1 Tax=Dokdonia pacifica TaxID=1627892 RepID=A0A238ZKA1_9FLAO|nr:hypothetical protein [Dokdonia pacifica]GGG06867.1 hypothetical protein GCM10011344_04190 [Dokdonia pacifica]SNR83408.1 hypothetical protein SAMN06265376_103281 [Dokdonia pacifica]